jgi:hypothetical protein
MTYRVGLFRTEKKLTTQLGQFKSSHFISLNFIVIPTRDGRLTRD